MGTRIFLACAAENRAVQAFVYTGSILPSLRHLKQLTDEEAKLFTENRNWANTYSITKEAHVLTEKALVHEVNADDEFSAKKAVQRSGASNPKKGFLHLGRSYYAVLHLSLRVVAMAGHQVADNEVEFLPYFPILVITILSKLLYLPFTFETGVPSSWQWKIEYLCLGTDCSIGKAKDKLRFEPAKDQHELLREVVAFEAKRL